MKIKPFLKWAGGKYRLLDTILRELPQGSRFVEPFAGSAAVYLNAPYARALVCDVNNDLISLYSAIQEEGEPFIKHCQSFFRPENNTRERFYELRELYNKADDSRMRGALLLYLNRHAFNGLVRYNSRGGYNVPFGRHKKPYFPLQELRAFHSKARTTVTEFAARDFRQVFHELEPGDVVYCDPPYAPLSHTPSFTAYAGAGFGASDQKELAFLAAQAWERGIPVILSNHDTKSARDLYAKAAIKQFKVQRYISRDAAKRIAVPEMLAIYR